MDRVASSPNIDQRRLDQELLYLSELPDDLLISKEEAEQAAQAAAGPEGGGPPIPGMDSVAGGGLPTDVPQPVPTGATGGMTGGAGHPMPAPPAPTP